MSLASIKAPSHFSCLLEHGKNVKSKHISVLSSGRRGERGTAGVCGYVNVCVVDRVDLCMYGVVSADV